MKITYSKCGDYLIPDLTVPDKEVFTVGKYGNLRRTFLKEHHNSIYSIFLMNGTLLQHLKEIDKTCNCCMRDIILKISKQENVTEKLKADNQMEWIRRMTSIHSRAEEFVLEEFVYGGFER